MKLHLPTGSAAAGDDPLLVTPEAAGWQRSLYAFLAEKERRSGSLRTVQSYSLMLQPLL